MAAVVAGASAGAAAGAHADDGADNDWEMDVGAGPEAKSKAGNGADTGAGAGANMPKVEMDTKLEGSEMRLVRTEDVHRMSVCRVTSATLAKDGLPVTGGINDIAMGGTDRTLKCGTCGETPCDGHFGHIDFTVPVLRHGYVNTVIATCRCVCGTCGRLKGQVAGEGDALAAKAGITYKRSPFVNLAPIIASTPATGPIRLRKMADAMKGRLVCPWSFDVTLEDGTVVPACGAPQPTYARPKENKLTIVRTYGDKQLAQLRDPEERLWALERFTASDMRALLTAIPVLTLATMGYRLLPPTTEPDGRLTPPRLLSHPRDMIAEAMLVAPPAIRPAMRAVDSMRGRGGENDLTHLLQAIVRQNIDTYKALTAYKAARAAAEAKFGAQVRAASTAFHQVQDAYEEAVLAHQAAVQAAQAVAASGDVVEVHHHHPKSGRDPPSRDPPPTQGPAAKRKRTDAGVVEVPPHIQAELAAAAELAAGAAVDAAESTFIDLLMARAAAAATEKAAFLLAWDKLTLECAAYISPAIKANVVIEGVKDHQHGRGLRRKQAGVKERLGGKRGRMRGNLCGRRTDQSGRSVIGPAHATREPWELGVPRIIMNTLTYPERVTSRNLALMQAAVRRGQGIDMGAATVQRPDALGNMTMTQLSMLDAAGRATLAASLQVGWIVERHLREGDWVLFNRQPTLHKASIMAFQAYPVDALHFELPVECTPPFNADYDGDEMNLHALQSPEAIAEAATIMAVPFQIVSPQSGNVLIALVQDALVQARLISAQDALVDREEAMQLASCIHFDWKGNLRAIREAPTGPAAWGFVDWLGRESAEARACRTPSVEAFLPTPAILKGTTWKTVIGPDGVRTRVQVPSGPRWTGSQIVSWVLPPGLALTKAVNGASVPTSWFDLETRASWLDDGNVIVVRDGELLCGRLCKQTVGRTGGGFVHALWRAYGAWGAAKWIGDMKRVLDRWSMHDTVAISLTDCLVSLEVEAEVAVIVKAGLKRVNDVLDRSLLQCPDQVREVQARRIMSDTVQAAGALVMRAMSPTSGMMQVQLAGSKGSAMTVTQMVALLGPHLVFGARIAARRGPDGGRRLMSFAPGDASAEAGGFVDRSFFAGMTARQMFNHLRSGREGVVNTGIATAQTGYNQRRMEIGQEAETVAADATVRVANGSIVVFNYGGDDYDGTFVTPVRLPAVKWSDVELVARTTVTLDQLVMESVPETAPAPAPESTTTAAAQVTPTHPTIRAARLYLAQESQLLMRARDLLRATRMTRSGVTVNVDAPWALPADMDSLVEPALAAARRKGILPRRVHRSVDTLAAARAVIHMASMVVHILRFILDAHDALSAAAGMRVRQNQEHGRMALTPTQRVSRLLEPFPGRLTDPSRIARAAVVLQLCSANMLRRHGLAGTPSIVLAHISGVFARMYRSALVATGEGVGSVGATSTGEPSMQLTLNTSHATGQESITTTGLPRLAQLMNAQDTKATASMTIRFMPPASSSLITNHTSQATAGTNTEAHATAFAQGIARVVLRDVVEASDIGVFPLVLGVIGSGSSKGAPEEEELEQHGLGPAKLWRRLRQLESRILSTTGASATNGWLVATDPLDNAAAANITAFTKRLTRAVSKATDQAAALLETMGDTSPAVTRAAMKKRRAAHTSSSTGSGAAVLNFGEDEAEDEDEDEDMGTGGAGAGAGHEHDYEHDDVGSISSAKIWRTAARSVACFRLSKTELVRRGLDVLHVRRALRRALVGDAAVTTTEASGTEWLVLVRVLDVPGRAGVTAAVWSGLPSAVRGVLERAVVQAVFETMQDALVVHGHPAIKRAFARKLQTQRVDPRDGTLVTSAEWVVDTDGSGLADVMCLPGVDPSRTTSNNVVESGRALGVEASVTMQGDELHAVIASSGSSLDKRHTRIMADGTGVNGSIAALTRHQAIKDLGSLWTRAGFEQPMDVMLEGAAFGFGDDHRSATAAVISGQPLGVGTGCVDILGSAVATAPKPAPYAPPLARADARQPSTMATIVRAAIAQAAQRERQRLTLGRHKPTPTSSTPVQDGVSAPAEPETAITHPFRLGVGPLSHPHRPGADDARFLPAHAAALVAAGAASASVSARGVAALDALVLPDEDAAGLAAGGRYEPWAIEAALGEAADNVAFLASQVREGATSGAPLELTAHLGRRTAAGFVDGVTPAVFRRLCDALAEYRAWSKTPLLVADGGQVRTDWIQSTDTTYALADGSVVRTIVDHDRIAEGVLATSHVEKWHIAHTDVEVEASAFAVRFAAGCEENVPLSRLPADVRPTRAQIKQRMEYRKGAWRITLTRVWEGVDSIAAEAAQRDSLRSIASRGKTGPDLTRYTVEVELVDPLALLRGGGLGLQQGSSLLRSASSSSSSVTQDDINGALDIGVAHALLARTINILGVVLPYTTALRALRPFMSTLDSGMSAFSGLQEEASHEPDAEEIYDEL